MDRVLTEEERIKRAEEIYARRKSGSYTGRETTVSVSEKRDFRLLKKVIIQLLICTLIYFIFYLINDTNYVFSESVISKTRQILSQDIDFEQTYKTVTSFFNINTENNDASSTVEGNNVEDEDTKQTNNDIQNEANLPQDTLSASEVNEEYIQEEPALDQMHIDANYIKDNYNIVKPLQGIISSEFGDREVTASVVTSYHNGIDIAADEGKDIVSAMVGTVITSSYSNSYGNYLIIQNGEITMVYAHCSELLAGEGTNVSKGQDIAKVGSSGNSTGPHLHFEVRVSGRYINPRYIIDF